MSSCGLVGVVGEDPAVAEALLEMEQPRWATDAYPESLPGAVLALAERLDLLTGLFAIGSGPTGSCDPFGLRRAALGLTGILRTQPRLASLPVSDLLSIAVAHRQVCVGRDRSRRFPAVVANHRRMAELRTADAERSLGEEGAEDAACDPVSERLLGMRVVTWCCWWGGCSSVCSDQLAVGPSGGSSRS